MIRRLFQAVRRWRMRRRLRTITLANARTRVRCGAEYLDDVHDGWHRRVHADSLELADGRHCVLGQIHGDFRLGLGRSHLINLSSAPTPNLSPVAYGFQCVPDVPDRWQDRDYRLLNRAWSEAIAQRQHADPSFVDWSPDAESPARSDRPSTSTSPAPEGDESRVMSHGG